MKRILTLFLCAALLMSFAPGAFASGETETVPPDCKSVDFEIDGKDYSVGFKLADSQDNIFLTGDGAVKWNYHGGEQRTYDIRAFIVARRVDRTDSGTEISEAEGVTVSVGEITLEPYGGAPDGVFSFSQYGYVAEYEGGYTDEGLKIYYTTGKEAWYTLNAAVTATDGEGKVLASGNICLPIGLDELPTAQYALYTSPEGGEENRVADGETVNYYELKDHALWLIIDEGAELRQGDFTVNSYEDSAKLEWQADGRGKITFAEQANNTYSVNIGCNEMWYTVYVDCRYESVAAGIELNGKTYLVGFVINDRVVQGRDSFWYSFAESEADDSWAMLDNGFSLGGDYPAGAPVELDVKSIALKRLSGDEQAFSLSESGYTDILKDTDSFILYGRPGSNAEYELSAELVITVDGVEQNARVSAIVVIERRPDAQYALYTSPEGGEENRVEMNGTVNYYELEEKALWLILDEDFPADADLSEFEVQLGGEVIDVTFDGDMAKIPLPENMTYNASLYVYFGGGYVYAYIDANSIFKGKAACVEAAGKTWVIGFADGDGDTVNIDEGNWDMGQIYDVSEPVDYWEPGCYFYVDSGRRDYDANGNEVYDTSDPGPFEYRVISDIRVESLTGDADAFSWAPDALVTERSYTEGDTLTLYLKPGCTARGRVIATISIEFNGRIYTEEIIKRVHVDRTVKDEYYREDGDTVAELNAFLAEEAARLEAAGSDSGPGSVNSTTVVHLADTVYEGEIVVPAGFRRAVHELRIYGGNDTTVRGGINFSGNGAAYVNGIDFIAPGTGTNEYAAWNGSGDFQYCTFSGYDIALLGDVNTMNTFNCVFADNGVAVLLSLGNTYTDMNRSDWTHNVFLNNGTAVEIQSLNDFVSPHYFRIRECSFINNDTDFDIDCKGTFYFYRNYYGRSLLGPHDSEKLLDHLRNGLWLLVVSNRAPQLDIDRGITKVVTNPRWYAPVSALDVPALSNYAASGDGGVSTLADEGDENYLTADWELPTEIILGEDGLEISAEAFNQETEEDKVVTVVSLVGDGSEGSSDEPVVLAVWNFGREAKEFTGSFNAGVEVTRGDDGSVTVEVAASNEALAALQPTLTIPNASGGVENGSGSGVSSEETDEGVSFVVTGGGEYVISEEVTVTEPEEPDEPDEPEDTGRPVRPGRPDGDEDDGDKEDEPGTPAVEFADVDEDDWFCDAVRYVTENGLMDGVAEGEFAPDTEVTRAMLVTVLWRAAGSPVVNYLLPFDDVPEGEWYTEAVRWAASEGLAEGVGETAFAPEASITREQFAAMLCRFTEYAGGDTSASAPLDVWSDAGEVSDWARGPLAWATAEVLITGDTETTISPKSPATRAQSAAILMRAGVK